MNPLISLLATSLIGKKFRTKVPFVWYCCNGDYNWHIAASNPDTTTLGVVNMTIKEPVEFTVINVVANWHHIEPRSYSNGYSYDIVIRVDKLIPIGNISFNAGQHYILETPNTKTGMKFSYSLEGSNRDSSNLSQNELQMDTNASANIYPFSPSTGFYLARNPDHTCNINAPAIVDTTILDEM